MSKNSVAMVVLASEQIMPNLEGLLSFHSQSTPLTHLYIYHTNDEERSGKPALRIKQMAERFLDNVDVTLHQSGAEEDGKRPDQVFNAIDTWFVGVPPERLVINATGGLKTMFAGAMQFIHSVNTIVIYRDLDGTWLRLFEFSSGLRSEPITVDNSMLHQRMKSLGIVELVKIQSGFPNIKPGKSMAIDCVDTLKKVILNQWDWSCLSIDKKSAGKIFEHWFASLVDTFEPDDLVVGLESFDEKRPQMETDVWVLKNSQLYMFDLKLISNKSKTSSLAEQITNASAQAEKFAGKNVKTILVRAGYSYQAHERKSLKQLASRFACRIWFQEDMVNILEEMGALFGQHSSAKETISQLIKNAKDGHGFLFSNPNFTSSFVKSNRGKKVVPLAQLFSEVDSLGYKWLGFTLATGQCFFHVAKQDAKKIDAWISLLRKNGCGAERIGSEQLTVTPRGVKGADYLKLHRSKSTMDSLFKML